VWLLLNEHLPPTPKAAAAATDDARRRVEQSVLSRRFGTKDEFADLGAVSVC
jgi:hypothetical protein